MQRILFALLLLGSLPLFSQPPADKAAAITRLQNAGAEWRVADDDFQIVRFPTGLAMPGRRPAEKAEAFLAEYGVAFGLGSPADWRRQRAAKGQNGWHYLRYEHQRNGTLVLGGGFTVVTDANGVIRGFTGTLLPTTSPAPAAAPTNRTDLPDLARRAIIAEYPQAMQWNVEEVAPVWTSANPWQTDPADPLVLTRSFDVSEPARPTLIRVHLAAATGKPVLHYPLHCELNRKLYNGSITPANLLWSEGNAFPGSLNGEQQEMLLATAETFHLYHRTFGRLGYDAADGLMNGISNYNPPNYCPNASASGNTINHCAGVVSDDIVAHEWTHNYIGSMNGLIYGFESGAINEAYADIFGESVDLLNTRGLDTNDGNVRSTCSDAGMRWKLGEGTSFGFLRDMWQPECKGDPSDRASGDYACGNADSGGVHSNSGLVNRTFSLLVDGGTLNGQTVTGIGLIKALHIFFHANNNYITRVTEFADLAGMLETSANDLLGVNLTALTLLDLSAAASGEIITTADVNQVISATLATQLAGSGPCPTSPTLAQDPPALCTEPVSNSYTTLFTEDWEAGMAGWSVVENPVSPGTWDAKPWVLISSLPDGRAGQGIYAPNPRGGDCAADLENGTVDLTSPVISLPADKTDFLLQFNHQYSLENNYDGGVLYLSRNGGPFAIITNGSFVYNGYDNALVSPPGNDNPLAGQPAFNGADQGSVSGTWGTSIVDLTAAGALPGDNLQIRWTIGHDGCNGWDGWYLDEVEVGYCEASVLPVTYLFLRATPAKDHIRLTWQTAAETQNQGFYVERRRADGTDFRELGFVAAGNGAYTFADRLAQPATTYLYRLRQTDFDGTAHFSDLVSARLEAGEQQLFAFPNPVADALTIITRNAAATAELFDATGRRVTTTSLVNGRAVLRAEALRPGVYVLRAGNEVVRVIVQ